MSEEEKFELEQETAQNDENNLVEEEQVPVEEQAEAPAEEPADELFVQEDAPAEPDGPAGKPRKPKKERKKPTKEQRKKRAIKALIIVGSILLAFAIFISSCAIANAVGVKALVGQGSQVAKVEYTEHTQLVPTKDSDGWWTFEQPTGRDFKIVQLTDVHIGGGCFSSQKDAWAMNAVATMIRAEQPDLVVVTGDIAYPVPFQAGTFNNLHATQIFSNLMEHLGVYWTFAFGNHDTEIYGTHNKKDIVEYYEQSNFKYCLFTPGDHNEEQFPLGDERDKGAGNSIIKVKNAAGIVTQAIVTLDSHSYYDGDYLGIQWKYDNLHKCQTEWYVAQMNALRAKNVELGGADEPVKNMAFFHIPTYEFREAWKQVIDKKGDVKKKTFEPGEAISDEVTYIYGVMGEDDKSRHGIRTYGVFCGYRPEIDNFFDEGMTHGLQAIFCGHDHYNNFSIDYKPEGADHAIRLTYGMSIDYLAYSGIYKVHAQRGCTVVSLKSDGSFTNVPKNYYADYGIAVEKGENNDLSY